MSPVTDMCPPQLGSSLGVTWTEAIERCGLAEAFAEGASPKINSVASGRTKRSPRHFLHGTQKYL
jgi:hypothetical protein